MQSAGFITLPFLLILLATPIYSAHLARGMPYHAHHFHQIHQARSSQATDSSVSAAGKILPCPNDGASPVSEVKVVPSTLVTATATSALATSGTAATPDPVAIPQSLSISSSDASIVKNFLYYLLGLSTRLSRVESVVGVGGSPPISDSGASSLSTAAQSAAQTLLLEPAILPTTQSALSAASIHPTILAEYTPAVRTAAAIGSQMRGTAALERDGNDELAHGNAAEESKSGGNKIRSDSGLRPVLVSDYAPEHAPRAGPRKLRRDAAGRRITRQSEDIHMHRALRQ